MVKSRPRRMLHFSSTPSDRIAWISCRTSSRGRRNTGHADGQHAARLGSGFENRDLVADPHQVVRHGESRNAGADHGDALVVAAIGRQHAVVVGVAVERVIAGLRTEAGSVTKRFSGRMATGASTSPRRQLASQGAPQTRPQMEANGLCARAMR